MLRKFITLLFILTLAGACLADEGLWPFNNVPRDAIKAKYGFEPSDAWLDHLRLSSVRFNNGGSGSFVGADGLVMTNHHVGEKCISELSSAGRDYNETGFYAETRDKEAACPQLELNVLEEISDVTAEVNAAVKPAMDAAARNTSQRAAMSRIEKECRDKTGSRCDVVVLYEGGAFNLYRYKKYTDVRLVFAPEAAIAFFGGDPDNFTYPRYDLDIAFFRVYENGKAARVEHYLKWNPRGPREGDVVFMSGNPGSTGRNLTVSQLEFLRDVAYPFRMDLLESRIAKLFAFSAQGPEQARIVRDVIFSYQNSLKAYKGYQSGLLDKNLVAKRAAAEQELRRQVSADPEKKKQFGAAWDAIAAAQSAYRPFYVRHVLLDSSLGLRQSKLFQIARHLVREPVERAKPNEKRLRDYRESNLDTLHAEILSPAPIYPAREVLLLTSVLSELAEASAGCDDPLLARILSGGTPAQAAARVVSGSKLGAVDERRRLLAGGQAAVSESKDTMVALARLVDAETRAVTKRYEDEVEAVERSNGSLVAKALFATRGTSLYPEATFTLRLSFGAVKGYVEDGKKIPYTTTFDGLYKKATGADPYKLPERWIKNKPKVNLSAPLNFVNTGDSIGGNSGSPMVDREGRLVGINFDSNLPRLPDRFLYTDERSRSVCVHSAGIIEALRNIYGANALVKELLP